MGYGQSESRVVYVVGEIGELGVTLLVKGL